MMQTQYMNIRPLIIDAGYATAQHAMYFAFFLIFPFPHLKGTNLRQFNGTIK